ncbi:MAG: TolC family protein [Candidatus Omnitrophica bacterium]|nr:TolC family protein [Candidatus Omnitrophota bacterium]
MAKRPPEVPVEPAAPQTLPPMTLEDCFDLSIKQSEILAIQNVDIERTWADFLTASSEAIGTVDFIMTDFRQKELKGGSGQTDSVGATFTKPQTRERYFEIQQPIFQGFKAVGALVGAKSLRKQRIYERDRAIQVLFLDVVDAFYTTLRFQREIEINQEILVLLKDRREDLAAREKIGKSRESEVVMVDSKIRTVEADLAQARGDCAIAKRMLEFLTGISLEGRTFLDETPPTDAPQDLDSYLPKARTRPDVEATHQAVRTAMQGIVVAQSDLWPEISLENRDYQRREGFESGIDWDLMLTIDIPLSKGGASLGKIKGAYSDWKIAKLNFKHTLRQAELDIKQSYEVWLSNHEQYLAYEKAVAASKENYKLQREDYAHNLVNNLDVLDALETLYRSLIDANKAYYTLKIAHRHFQVAIGACCESI